MIVLHSKSSVNSNKNNIFRGDIQIPPEVLLLDIFVL